MPWFVTALLMTTFFVAGLTVALPIIDRVGSTRLPRKRRAASVRDQAALVVTGPAFTPLQMSDSGQKWPSEVPDRRTPLVMPVWPSEMWEDNPFPASAAIAKQLSDAPPRSSKAPGTTHARETKGVPASRPRRKASALRKARPQSKARAQQKRARPQPQGQREIAAKHQPQSRPPAPPTAQDGLPEATIILEIANDPSRGLASAVDMVRQSTGWSFQRAAQHVASVLRGAS